MISGYPGQFGNHNLSPTEGKNKNLRLGGKVPFCSLPLSSHLQGLFPLFYPWMFWKDVLGEGSVSNFGDSLETLGGVSGKAKRPQISRRKLGDRSQASLSVWLLPPCPDRASVALWPTAHPTPRCFFYPACVGARCVSLEFTLHVFLLCSASSRDSLLTLAGSPVSSSQIQPRPP